MVRRAIELSKDPVEALIMTSYNPAQYFGSVKPSGALAPGFIADMVVTR